MTRLTIALLAVCLSAVAQQSDIFTFSYAEAITSSTRAVSFQLPASGRGFAQILETTVQCSAACNIRVESAGDPSVANGTTIVAGTLAPLNPESTPAETIAAPKLEVYYGSAIPAGLYQHSPSTGWTLPAGGILPLGGGKILDGKDQPHRYVVRILGDYTGTVKVYGKVAVRR